MKIGLMKESDVLPKNTKVLSNISLFNEDWLKVKGVNISDKSANLWEQLKSRNNHAKKEVYVDSKDLTLLFPDDSMAELVDMSVDMSDKTNRGKALKVLSILNQSVPLRATSPVFEAQLQWLKILPSFGDNEIAIIKDEIGI